MQPQREIALPIKSSSSAWKDTERANIQCRWYDVLTGGRRQTVWRYVKHRGGTLNNRKPSGDITAAPQDHGSKSQIDLNQLSPQIRTLFHIFMEKAKPKCYTDSLKREESRSDTDHQVVPSMSKLHLSPKETKDPVLFGLCFVSGRCFHKLPAAVIITKLPLLCCDCKITKMQLRLSQGWIRPERFGLYKMLFA